MALTNLPNTATLFDIVEKLKEKSVLDESDKELLKTKMDEVPIDYSPESTLSDLIKVASLHLKEGGDTGGPVSWEEILNKPSTYPTTWNDVASKPSVFKPEAHNHNGDSLTPYHIGLVGTPVKSGYFDTLFVNGNPITPGGDVTYESVNNAIKGKEINPQSVFSKNNALKLLVQDDALGQGFSIYKDDTSTSLLPFPANGIINIGEDISRINEGHFETLFVGGQEIVPGGGGSDPTLEQINTAINGQSITPGSLDAPSHFNLRSTGNILIKPGGANDQGLALKKVGDDTEITSSGQSNIKKLRLGTVANTVREGHFDKIFVNTIDIEAELVSQKNSLIDSINAIKAVL